MYYHVFQAIFDIAKARYQLEARWRHIHGSGFGCVLSDQDTKQVPGLCRYLASQDTSKPMSWEDHSCQIIKLCKVHFSKRLELYFPRGSETYNTMLSLRSARSLTEYQHICDVLEGWLFPIKKI